MSRVDKFVMRIEAVPVAKERPRFTKYGGSYTPKKTADFEKVVAESWREQIGETLIDSPVHVFMNFGVVNMNKDLDNLCKTILDGLNKVAWTDDRLVYKLDAWKYPASKGYEHAHVIVRKLES